VARSSRGCLKPGFHGNPWNVDQQIMAFHVSVVQPARAVCKSIYREARKESVDVIAQLVSRDTEIKELSGD
jgi:hypothetical protein